MRLSLERAPLAIPYYVGVSGVGVSSESVGVFSESEAQVGNLSSCGHFLLKLGVGGRMGTKVTSAQTSSLSDSLSVGQN